MSRLYLFTFWTFSKCVLELLLVHVVLAASGLLIWVGNDTGVTGQMEHEWDCGRQTECCLFIRGMIKTLTLSLAFVFMLANAVFTLVCVTSGVSSSKSKIMKFQTMMSLLWMQLKQGANVFIVLFYVLLSGHSCVWETLTAMFIIKKNINNYL